MLSQFFKMIHITLQNESFCLAKRLILFVGMDRFEL